MQLTGHITLDSLMSLEAYTKWRKIHKPEVLAHRKLRSVHLGENVHVQFESETTIRYQIQEMLRIEKVFEEEGIQQEKHCNGDEHHAIGSSHALQNEQDESDTNHDVSRIWGGVSVHEIIATGQNVISDRN